MQEILTAPEALKLYRERAGLSQFDTARKLGITSPTILSMIETGKRTPNAKLAVRIERLFNIPAGSWNTDAEAA